MTPFVLYTSWLAGALLLTGFIAFLCASIEKENDHV